MPRCHHWYLSWRAQKFTFHHQTSSAAAYLQQCSYTFIVWGGKETAPFAIIHPLHPHSGFSLLCSDIHTLQLVILYPSVSLEFAFPGFTLRIVHHQPILGSDPGKGGRTRQELAVRMVTPHHQQNRETVWESCHRWIIIPGSQLGPHWDHRMIAAHGVFLWRASHHACPVNFLTAERILPQSVSSWFPLPRLPPTLNFGENQLTSPNYLKAVRLCVAHASQKQSPRITSSFPNPQEYEHLKTSRLQLDQLHWSPIASHPFLPLGR